MGYKEPQESPLKSFERAQDALKGQRGNGVQELATAGQ